MSDADADLVGGAATAEPTDLAVLEGLEQLAAQAATCVRCDLAAGRNTVVFGSGDPTATLMIVGEAPGVEEDRGGRPFIGRSGRLLDEVLRDELRVAREAIYITNTVKCRPPANRNPRPAELAACRPYLDEQIRRVCPRVIITLGNVSTRLLLGTTEGITRVRGRAYTLGRATLVPTLHPAAVLRGGPAAVEALRHDMRLARAALDEATA